MSSVKDTFDSLRMEFNLWQGLLVNCKDKPDNCSQDDNWTLKDVLAHLTSWQEVTLARLVAARLKEEPEYPAWFPGVDPETDEETNKVNAAIYKIYKDQSLSNVKNEWEQRFSEILLVCSLISEDEFSEPGKYQWLNGYPLVAVIEGTLGHHREHRDLITGKKNPSQ
ncbi:MAG TPA: hypothetical protein DIW44_01945 [Anaerolineaceae bacterium]|nr:hypothetical protein [Anaerolineaceae bacterium]